VGLITGLVTLPLAPLRGVVAVAEQVRRQAEEEYFDPVRIRELLTDVQRRREDGDLSDEEATALEDELVERLVVSRERRGGVVP
jgi:chorismate mutase